MNLASRDFLGDFGGEVGGCETSLEFWEGGVGGVSYNEQ